MKKRFLLVFFTLNYLLFFSQGIEVTNQTKSVIVSDKVKDSYVDVTDTVNFEFLLKNQNLFSKNTKTFLDNPDYHNSYWYKISLRNTSENNFWYLVSHNYMIEEIEIYSQDENGVFINKTIKNNSNVYDRDIQHKQPVFEINIPTNSTRDIYVKIKNNYSFKYTFELYAPNYFITKYFWEYQWFGIFYGMLIFVVMYALLMYLSLNEKTQLFYLIFMTSQILFMLFRDGTIVFLIGSLAAYSVIAKNFSMVFFSISLLIFSIQFLKIRKKSWLIFISIIAFIRIFIFIMFMDDMALWIYNYDMAILTICFVSSFYNLKTEFKRSIYFVAGLFCLWSMYLIYYLSMNNLLNVGGFSFFGLYYGIVAEAIFFTFSLGNDIKILNTEKNKQGILNGVLEVLVEERTLVINKQNKDLELKAEELNQFLYKSSHDFKGPIKTIEGLCNLAKIDDPKNQLIYVEKILERAIALDELVKDLQKVTLTKNLTHELQPIDFNILHKEIIDIFEAFPGKNDVIITNNFEEAIFVSDPRLIKSIYQNLFENAIEYRDPCKAQKTLHISTKFKNNNFILSFKDTGLGIDEAYQPFVFDMFYRANTNTHTDGNGLGLYLVKISVEKLNGKINLKSTLHQGSTFEIILPNYITH